VITKEVEEALQAYEAKSSTTSLFTAPLYLGSHSLKGIPEDVAIYQVLPASLSLRTFAPLRTATNEAKAEAAATRQKASHSVHGKGFLAPGAPKLDAAAGSRNGSRNASPLRSNTNG
jgi:hypothetical protein